MTPNSKRVSFFCLKIVFSPSLTLDKKDKWALIPLDRRKGMLRMSFLQKCIDSMLLHMFLEHSIFHSVLSVSTWMHPNKIYNNEFQIWNALLKIVPTMLDVISIKITKPCVNVLQAGWATFVMKEFPKASQKVTLLLTSLLTLLLDACWENS